MKERPSPRIWRWCCPSRCKYEEAEPSGNGRFGKNGKNGANGKEQEAEAKSTKGKKGKDKDEIKVPAIDPEEDFPRHV